MNAGDLSADTRQAIANELGLPATCFVSAVTSNSVTARFHSTEREHPMCGHGTICLMSHLLNIGLLQLEEGQRLEVDLILPTTTARVEILHQPNNLPLVMLDIKPPIFRANTTNINALSLLFNLTENDFATPHSIETALGDFTHLIVPINTLTAIQSIKPDFSAITAYCKDNGIETIACFSTDTENADADFHVRDFCPAVGVPESAAAGTTNAALASYLLRHGIIKDNGTGEIHIKVEQGLELGRPSTIYTSIELDGAKIIRLQVGGVARKVLEGQLEIS